MAKQEKQPKKDLKEKSEAYLRGMDAGIDIAREQMIDILKSLRKKHKL